MKNQEDIRAGQGKLVTNGRLVSVALVGALLGATATAHGEEVIEHRVVRGDTATTYSSPNRALIWSGAFLLGATYIPSVIVGATSDYNADRKLYIPVAGPWMDLSERKGECGRGGAPSCDHEDLYQALIIADGIAQGLGALQIASGFLFPVHQTTVTTEAKWHVMPHLSPYMLGIGIGHAL